MGLVRIYVATSADGFIADRDGGVDWLDGHDRRRYGYDAFWESVGAVVMGRRTFEHVQMFADAWPYAGRRTFVLSSRPGFSAGSATGVTITKAPIAEVVRAAEAAGRGDVWIVGGAVTMRSALEQDLVDLIDIFYVPVLLGDGIPLIGAMRQRLALQLETMRSYPDGVFSASYRPAAARR